MWVFTFFFYIYSNRIIISIPLLHLNPYHKNTILVKLSRYKLIKNKIIMNDFLKKILEYLALISITGLMMFFILKLSLGRFSDLTEINKSIKSVESVTKSIQQDQSVIIIKLDELEKGQNLLSKNIQKNNNLLKSNNSELVKLRKQYWSLSKNYKQTSQPISRISTISRL